MNTKSCKNCQQSFVITPDDLSFYTKIGVPEPTLCSDCRMQRRLLWRNEHILHKRKSSLTGKDIISQYGENTLFPVYSIPEFYSRDWEVPFLEWDPNRGFFEQFRELQLKTPRRALLTDFQSIENNSVYQNAASRNKNCYMVFAAGDNEDCLYGHDVDRSKTVVDGLWTRRMLFSYDCVDSIDSSRIFFSQECHMCVDSWFLFDCKNCINCFGCVGLRNKSYCIWNKQLTKEEYELRVKELQATLSQKKIVEYRIQLEQLKVHHPRKYAHIDSMSSSTCTGDYILNSKNVIRSFTVHDSENVRYSAKAIHCRECWDINDWGDPAEMCYESITIGDGAYRILFSSDCWPNCSDLQYCDSCSDSAHLFGCVGLKNASYCILNKQYSKKEYEVQISRIVENMKQRGEYGEFFPPNLSSVPYNESIAQEYFPLVQKIALEKGYHWAELETRDYHITKTVADIPERITDVGDDILKEIIECKHKGTRGDNCATAFRITSEELQFYRQFGLPVPHLCFFCRNAQRFTQRNPMKLWNRQCTKCGKDIQSSYSPDRPEIVYCGECYNAEIT